MTADDTGLQAFFSRYAEATVANDVDTIAGSYFSTYIEASPGAVGAFVVDDDYREKLRERAGTMSGLGLKAATAKVTGIREICAAHDLVDVTWTLRFEPVGKAPVSSSFVQSYVVRGEAPHYQILCYVSHEDQQAVMKRDGVI